MSKWQPMQRAKLIPKTEQEIEQLVDSLREHGFTETQIRDQVAKVREEGEVWLNNRYQVYVRRVPNTTDGPDLVHLSIRRLDRKPIHDWRDLQNIKNDLVGPECEGVELYPAESRLVDSANQYHLWVIDDPKFRFPVGFSGRFVVNTDGSLPGGGRQRGRP